MLESDTLLGNNLACPKFEGQGHGSICHKNKKKFALRSQLTLSFHFPFNVMVLLLVCDSLRLMGNSPKVTELIKLKDENKKVKGMVAEFKSALEINNVLNIV